MVTAAQFTVVITSIDSVEFASWYTGLLEGFWMVSDWLNAININIIMNNTIILSTSIRELAEVVVAKPIALFSHPSPVEWLQWLQPELDDMKKNQLSFE